MSDIIKEVGDHVPKGFLRHYVLLSANMTVFALYDGAAIQAILFLSLGDMGQTKNFLKNKYKKIQDSLSFPLHVNSGNFEELKPYHHMKFLLVPAFFVCSFSLHAQYYYNDIIGTMETNRMMQTYLANKVKTVSVDGYTPQGSKTTDFSETHEVRENGKVLKIVTTTSFNRVANYRRFDDKGRLSSVTDTSMGVANTTIYEYDNAGRLVMLQNSVKDPESEIDQVETHQWIYNKDGKPEKMWRIVNKTDSLEVRFIPDENGDPGEEIMYKRGKETDHVYYYFDEEGRISDIVRFDEKVKKLVPDNIFSYDEAGRVLQVVTNSIKDNIGIGRLGKAYFVRYMIWRYVYNENGLKTNDVLFNANQEITGKIKYNYTFGQ